MRNPANVIEVRGSIAIGAALIVQTALALIWIGAASERLNQLERRVDYSSQLIERTARLEEQVHYMRQSLDRIEQKLDTGITPGVFLQEAE